MMDQPPLIQSVFEDVKYRMDNKKKILLVDDEIFNIEGLKGILESHFLLDPIDEICHHAMDGQQALD